MHFNEDSLQNGWTGIPMYMVSTKGSPIETHVVVLFVKGTPPPPNKNTQTLVSFFNATKKRDARKMKPARHA